MNIEDMPNNTTEYNSGLLSLNNFLIEQAEINEYAHLIKSIVNQLDRLLKPVATVYSEYDAGNKVLRIIEINANQDVLNLLLKFGGRKILSTVTPVNDDMYKKMVVGRLEIVSSLHEATGGTVPKNVSSLIGKALSIKCYLGISFVIDGHVYGTAVIALKKQPEQYILELLRTYAHFTSISLRRTLAEQALKASEQELKTVTENMTDMVSMTDAEGRITCVSGSYYKLLGYNKDELLGKTVFEVVFEEDLPEVLARFQKAIATGENDSVEYRAVKKDGNIIWLETLGNFLTDSNGSVNGAIFSLRDITERKKAEEYIRYISFHDQLTGLYNRHYFEHCRNELENIPVISVIVTDINSLKLVNDTYGHEYGDQLIKEYARILKQSFKQSDLIFRWGGDEFIVILSNTGEARSWELYNRLDKHCGNAYVKDIPLSISVGISSKMQGENIEKALSEAESMMYNNKIKESKNSKKLIIETILQALSDISHETKDHTERMSLICHQFGKYLDLSSSELSRLDTLTMLHDIGLINIDSDILLKESPLINEEWDEIRKHPGVGYHITRSTEEFAYVAEEILAHHERWDGKGYPQGLAGENIPYLARILNIIDSYEVMSYGRPYKKKMSIDEIIEEIERCSGQQFDPELAEDFVVFLKEGYADTDH